MSTPTLRFETKEKLDKANIGCCNAGACNGDHNEEMEAFIAQIEHSSYERGKRETAEKMGWIIAISDYVSNPQALLADIDKCLTESDQ